MTGVVPAAAAADAEFAALYERQFPRLVRALQLAGSAAEAEDLAQEAFARTLLHWWRVRHGANPAGYVFRVAFRLERRRTGHERFARGGDPAGVAAADDYGEATVRADLERALSRMPSARRRCAVLALLADLPPAEIARALRIAPSTVRKQVSLARADLDLALRAVQPEV